MNRKISMKVRTRTFVINHHHKHSQFQEYAN